MLEVNVNVRFPDLLEILEQFKQNLPTLNDLVNRQPEPPVLNDLVNRQPEVTPTPEPSIAPPGSPAYEATKDKPLAETTPVFTLAQVARAGADLLTAKPALQPKLIETLGKYGAATVVDLKPEHLAAFADDIRKMGAKI